MNQTEKNGGHLADTAQVDEDDKDFNAWLKGRIIANEALADARHDALVKRFEKLEESQEKLDKKADLIQALVPSTAEKRALLVGAFGLIMGVLAKLLGVQVPEIPTLF